MKVFLASIAAGLILLGTPRLFAAGLTYVGPSEQTVAESLSKHSARSALNINMEGPSQVVYILGGASASGLYGAFYRTDVGITAPGVSESGLVHFTLYVLPANTEGNGALYGHSYTLPPGGFGILKDVVGNAGVSGAATIVLIVNTSTSTASSAYQYLSAWGRTYTAAPTGGQFSTTLAVTSGYTLTTADFVVATGIQQDSSRRTNVSAFNHGTTSDVTLRYFIFDATGANIGSQDVTIPPMSSVQIALSAFSVGDPGGTMRAGIVSSTGTATVYAVTVDNATNDGDVRLLTYSFY